MGPEASIDIQNTNVSMTQKTQRSPRKAPTPKAVRIKSNKRGVKRPSRNSISEVGNQNVHDQSTISKKSNCLPEISTKVNFKYIDMNDFAKTT